MRSPKLIWLAASVIVSPTIHTGLLAQETIPQRASTTSVQKPPSTDNQAQPLGAPSGAWINFAFSQALSSNWTQGGQDFVSLNTSFRASQPIIANPVSVALNLNLRFGATYVDDTTSDDQLRVADNDVFAEAVASYSLNWKVNPFVSFSVRTPITESFQRIGRSRTRNANFWDPVTSSQSAGFTFEQRWSSEWFASRLGMSLVELRANDHRAMTNDPKTPEIDGFRFMTGVESVTETGLQLDSSVFYTGRLGLFGTFEDLGVWTLRSENQFRIQIWKSVGVLLDVLIVQDIKQSRRTQIKQTLSFGLLHKF